MICSVLQLGVLLSSYIISQMSCVADRDILYNYEKCEVNYSSKTVPS